MAQIAAVDLFFLFPDVTISLTSFGAPRVGNHDFARLVHEIAPDGLRVTHNRDLVPALPPHLAGFHHAPTEIYTRTDDAVPGVVEVKRCDESGEDPTCYDGVCGIHGYGMCTSISDHLEYLGIHVGDMSCVSGD